jgi:hypothetical protein
VNGRDSREGLGPVVVGLKLLLAPGGRTLGCTGLMWLLAAVSLLAVIVNVPNQPSTTMLFLAVVIAFSGVMGVASVLVAQYASEAARAHLTSDSASAWVPSGRVIEPAPTLGSRRGGPSHGPILESCGGSFRPGMVPVGRDRLLAPHRLLRFLVTMGWSSPEGWVAHRATGAVTFGT